MNGPTKDGLLIEVIKDIKNSQVYKDELEKFPDANLIDVVTKTKDKD